MCVLGVDPVRIPNSNRSITNEHSVALRRRCDLAECEFDECGPKFVQDKSRDLKETEGDLADGPRCPMIHN